MSAEPNTHRVPSEAHAASRGSPERRPPDGAPPRRVNRALGGIEMDPRTRLLALALALAGVALLAAGCGGSSSKGEEAKGPATVYEAEGKESSRIELTAAAAKRLGIETAAVATSGTGKVVPYSAVFYSASGETWVYTSPQPLEFVREPITVTSIDGDKAFISAGPAEGTQVATVGVAELFGAESGLGQ